MIIRKYFAICIVAVACLVATLCNSCSVEDTFSAGSYTYPMQVDAVLNGYDGASTRSGYDWPDGAKLYVQFYEGENRVQGFAEYNETNDLWTVTTRTGLSNVSNARCEAYYFGHSAESADVVELSESAAVYQDLAGSYINNGNGLIVSLALTPRTGRIRFCGEVGRSFTVSGLTHLSTYETSSNNFSSTSKSLSLTVSEDGYTPYLYASFPEASRTMVIVDGKMEYTRECTESVLLSGRSGSMTLPSASSHDGWVMEEINQIDESAVAEAIDLGLSVEWASWNMGATAPEEFGGYYAWGETEVKSDYSENTYLYYQNGEYVDIGADISGTEYDVAHVKWSDGWRMPTQSEMRELIDKCTREWITVNGVDGFIFTGPNGNSIFLPSNTYWASTYSEGPMRMADVFEVYSYYCDCHPSGRTGGNTVRPVRNKKVEEEPSAPVVEKVDLGLSVKWASWNVGATAPEEYGDYFAWGETKVKDDYSANTYLYYQNGEYVDIGSDISGTEYDVAHVKWSDGWRMPTLNEIKELIDNCTWSWTTQNGVKGYKVTGPNGNSIFLPAAGYRGGTEVYSRGSDGYYRSGTLGLGEGNSGNACDLFFHSSGHDWSYSARFNGQTVRPVYGASKSKVSITTGDATDITDGGATLSGTVSNSSDKSLTCGIIYGTSSTLSSTSGTMLSTTSSGEFSVSVTGLSASTTYYYCAYVVVDGEYTYGEVLSFTTESETITVGDAIDLGLSVKWASWNVGATAPEEYGSYYAWGETKAKSSYTEDNSITYGLSTSELESRGIMGSDGNLTAAYDAATVNLGSPWRMPTLDEFKELLDKCTWSWTTQNDVNGFKVTGSNGNSIFLPAAGRRNGTEVVDRGSDGAYWSGTLNENRSNYAYYLGFGSGGHGWYSYHRFTGHTVRPVTAK